MIETIHLPTSSSGLCRTLVVQGRTRLVQELGLVCLVSFQCVCVVNWVIIPVHIYNVKQIPNKSAICLIRFLLLALAPPHQGIDPPASSGGIDPPAISLSIGAIDPPAASQGGHLSVCFLPQVKVPQRPPWY